MNPFFACMIKEAGLLDAAGAGMKYMGRAAVTGAGKAMELGAKGAHKALYVDNGKGGKRLSLTRSAGAAGAAYLGMRAVKSNSDFQNQVSRDYGENRHSTGMNPTFGAGK